MRLTFVKIEITEARGVDVDRDGTRGILSFDGVLVAMPREELVRLGGQIRRALQRSRPSVEIASQDELEPKMTFDGSATWTKEV